MKTLRNRFLLFLITAIFIFQTAVFVMGFWRSVDFSTWCLQTTCELSASDEAYLNEHFPISLRWALLETLILRDLLLPLVFFGAGFAILWFEHDRWLPIAMAELLIGYAAFVGGPFGAAGVEGTAWAWVYEFFSLAWLLVLPLVLLAFPNGQLRPRGSVLVLVGISLVSIFSSFFPQTTSPVLEGTLIVGGLACFGIQFYRYQNLYSPAQRQQAKWGILGLMGMTLNGILWLTLFANDLGTLEELRRNIWFQPLSAGLNLLLPITLFIAIRRYRLWDIDLIVRRTLIYALLTGFLAFLYFGGVVVLQSLFSSLTRQENSPLITVISTLSIAALFTPLRSRIQNFIDRRFYRKKYNAELALAQFATIARDEVDMDKLTAALIGVVQETVQPQNLSIWVVNEARKEIPGK